MPLAWKASMITTSPSVSVWYALHQILILFSYDHYILAQCTLLQVVLVPFTMQHFGKAALRVTKNYTKGYSDTQAKVRDATSNDPWGPSGTQMNEIAQLTYNQLSG